MDEVQTLRRKLDVTLANVKLRLAVIILYTIGVVLCIASPLVVFFAIVALFTVDHLLTINMHFDAMSNLKLKPKVSIAQKIMTLLSLFNLFLYSVAIGTVLYCITKVPSVMNELAVFHIASTLTYIIAVFKLSILIIIMDKLYNMYLFKIALKLEYKEPPIARFVKMCLDSIIDVRHIEESERNDTSVSGAQRSNETTSK